MVHVHLAVKNSQDTFVLISCIPIFVMSLFCFLFDKKIMSLIIFFLLRAYMYCLVNLCDELLKNLRLIVVVFIYTSINLPRN